MSTLSITWHLVLGFLDRTSDCICEIVSRHISYPVNNAMHSQIKAESKRVTVWLQILAGKLNLVVSYVVYLPTTKIKFLTCANAQMPQSLYGYTAG